MDFLGGGDGGDLGDAAVGAAVVASVVNPAAGDAAASRRDVEEDSDAESVPGLVLVQVYGGKLMQLGSFVPFLLVFFGAMNAYRRNYVFVPWELEARCYVDEDAPFFTACYEEAASGVDGNAAEAHCMGHFCRVRDEAVIQPDTSVIGADAHGWAPWVEGKPCPTGYGQTCIPAGEIDPAELTPLNLL